MVRKFNLWFEISLGSSFTQFVHLIFHLLAGEIQLFPVSAARTVMLNGVLSVAPITKVFMKVALKCPL